MSNTQNNQAEQAAASNGGHQRGFFRRRWKSIAAGSVAAIILLVLLAPTLVSTGMGRSYITGVIDDMIAGSVRIGSMSLGWFSGQSIGDIELLDPQGKTVATVKEVSTELTLWQVLTSGSLNLGKTPIKDPVADVQVDENGVSNLQKAIAMTKPSEPSEEPTKLPASLAADLSITGGKIEVSGPGFEKVTFDQLEVRATLASISQPLTVSLAARSTQGGVSGSVKADATVTGAIHESGELTVAAAQTDATVTTQKLAMAGIDRLAGLNGVLQTGVGDYLDLSLKAKVTPQQIDAGLTAQSTNLDAKLAVRKEGDTLSAEPGSRVAFKATPAFVAAAVNEYLPQQKLKLEADVPLEVTVQRLVAPLGEGGLKMAEVSIAAAFKSGGAIAITQGEGAEAKRFVFEGLAANVEAARLGDELKLAAGGDIKHGQRAGEIAVDLRFEKLFDAKGQLRPDALTPQGSAKLTNLPVELADELTAGQYALAKAIGPTLTVNVQTTGEGEQRTLALDVASANVTASGQVMMGQRLAPPAGAKPWTAHVNVTREAVKHWVTLDESVVLPERMGLTLTLAEDWYVTRPGEGQGWFRPGAMRVAGAVKLDEAVTLQPPGLDEPVTVQALNVALTGDTLSQPKVSITASAKPAKSDGRLAALAGGELTLTAEAATKLAEDGKVAAPIVAALQVKGATLSAQAAADVAADMATATVKQADATVTATPATLQRLGVLTAEPGSATLAEPITATVNAKPLTVPLKEFSLSKLSAAADIAVPRIALAGNERLNGAALDNAKGNVAFDGTKGGQVTASLTAATTVPGQSQRGDLSMTANLNNALNKEGQFALDGAAGKVDAKLSGVPTAFVDALAGQGGQLVALLGPGVDVTTTAVLSDVANRRGTASLAVRSAQAKASAEVKLAERLELAKPAELALTLTPASYEAWQTARAAAKPAVQPATPPATAPQAQPAEPAPAPYTLAEPVTLTAQVTSLRLPTGQPAEAGNANADATKPDEEKPFDLRQLGVQATLSATPIAMKDPATNQITRIRGLTAKLDAPDFAQPLKFDVAAKISPPAAADQAAAPEGDLTAAGALSGLFNNVGAVDTAAMNAKVAVEAKQMPVAWLDATLAAAVGDKVDITFNTDLTRMTGPVALHVKGASAGAKVLGRIDEDHFTLTENAEAHLMVTRDLIRKYVNHPMLKEVVQCLDPVSVNVQKEGFRVPIREFALTACTIPKVTIAPGRLIVEKAGLVKVLVEMPVTVGNLAKVDLGKIADQYNRNQLPAWFTPIDISIVNGVITYSRMDVLLGSDYQVATWGTVDLNNNTGDMVLGLAERAMRKIYDVKLYVNEPDYVDQFPMKGPLATLGPDKADMSGRLVLLMGLGTAGKVGGDKVSGLLDKVLQGASAVDQAINPKRKDVKPAPPARTPFPWPAEQKATATTQPAPDAAAQQPKPADETKPTKPTTPKAVEDALKDLGDLFKKK